MTPKEKAHEIWMKLFQKQIEVNGNGDGNLCVELATIIVDEILKTFNARQGGRITSQEGFQSYWQEVKKEIEKL